VDYVFCYLRKQDYTIWILANSLEGEDRDSDSWRKGHYISYINIIRKIWAHNLWVILSYFVTLALFPGLISEIPSSYGISKDWFSILLITVFNVADLAGKTLPRWYTNSREKFLWISVIARLIFVPLFIFCLKPRILSNDVISILLVIIFGASSGYLASVAMSLGPQQVQPHEQELAGTIMITASTIGLVFGSVASLALLPIIN